MSAQCPARFVNDSSLLRSTGQGGAKHLYLRTPVTKYGDGALHVLRTPLRMVVAVATQAGVCDSSALDSVHRCSGGSAGGRLHPWPRGCSDRFLLVPNTEEGTIPGGIWPWEVWVCEAIRSNPNKNPPHSSIDGSEVRPSGSDGPVPPGLVSCRYLT